MEYGEKHVILNLQEYEDMSKEIKQLEEGNAVEISTQSQFWGYSNGLITAKSVRTFITKDETVKEIAGENEKLIKRIEELEKDANNNYQSLRDAHIVKGKNIFDVRQMTMSEFRKWRRR